MRGFECMVLPFSLRHQCSFLALPRHFVTLQQSISICIHEIACQILFSAYTRLTGLALIHVNFDVDIDVGQIYKMLVEFLPTENIQKVSFINV